MNEDFARILESLSALAEEYLEDGSAFPPSGAMIDNDGELTLFGTEGEGENPQSHVRLLEKAFRDSADNGKCRAFGFCVDVTAQRPGDEEERDAVMVSMEREGGEAVDVFIPYLIDPELDFDEPFGDRREPRVFSAE